MHRRILILSVVLALLAVALVLLLPRLREPPAPQLPSIDLSSFEAAVREQVAAAQAAARARPNEADAVGELGRILHAYGQHAAAAEAYARARALAPGAFPWKYLHGRVLATLGRNPEALRALRAATAQRPDYLPAWLAVAEILLATDRAQVAAGLYRKLLEHMPDSPVIRFGLGQALASSDPPAAIEHLERVLAGAESFGAAHYQLALLYRDRGERGKAERHMDLYRRYKGRQPAQADPLLRQVEALNRGSRQLATQAKRVLAMGDLDRAAALLERALTQDPAYAGAHAALVFVYWRLGDAAQAQAHYREAVELEPNTIEAYLNYGMLLGSQDRLAEAAAVFEQGLAVDPGNATGHTFLGYIRERQGQTQEAAALYQKALELDPSQPRANFLLGRRLLAAGQGEQAAFHFEAAVVDGGPGSLWFLRQIAAAYGEAGDPERARPYQAQADRMAAAAP